MQEFLPNDLLKPIIRCYRVFESEDESINNILPSTALAIAFQLHGTVAYVRENSVTDIPSAAIIGLQQAASVIRYQAHKWTDQNEGTFNGIKH